MLHSILFWLQCFVLLARHVKIVICFVSGVAGAASLNSSSGRWSLSCDKTCFFWSLRISKYKNKRKIKRNCFYEKYLVKLWTYKYSFIIVSHQQSAYSTARYEYPIYFTRTIFSFLFSCFEFLSTYFIFHFIIFNWIISALATIEVKDEKLLLIRLTNLPLIAGNS